jgi:hypothetical protein
MNRYFDLLSELVELKKELKEAWRDCDGIFGGCVGYMEQWGKAGGDYFPYEWRVFRLRDEIELLEKELSEFGLVK